MSAIPLDDLECASGDRDQRFGKAEEERAQPGVSPSWRFRRIRGKRNRDARDTGKITEIVSVAAHAQFLELGQLGHDGRILRVSHENLVVAKGKRERSVRQRFGAGVARSESLGGIHGEFAFAAESEKRRRRSRNDRSKRTLASRRLPRRIGAPPR
jgi:hypothetical protein